MKKLIQLLGLLMSVFGIPRWLFAPPVEFIFDPKNGLSGRVVTPNNDGANDLVYFRFNNPLDSRVELFVYDVTGALIYSAAGLSGQNALTWDGKGPGGAAVASGVYIYQIVAEGKTFNGTIVVAR
ncbi:MAG: gliding motility-associated C-terminal domain-containing protein [Elusimicrobia bacterium]|nr:gliding motility-associated C-terminal domain-containing protein [Elusimicrobiota bacterium]